MIPFSTVLCCIRLLVHHRANVCRLIGASLNQVVIRGSKNLKFSASKISGIYVPLKHDHFDPDFSPILTSKCSSLFWNFLYNSFLLVHACECFRKERFSFCERGYFTITQLLGPYKAQIRLTLEYRNHAWGGVSSFSLLKSKQSDIMITLPWLPICSNWLLAWQLFLYSSRRRQIINIKYLSQFYWIGFFFSTSLWNIHYLQRFFIATSRWFCHKHPPTHYAR